MTGVTVWGYDADTNEYYVSMEGAEASWVAAVKLPVYIEDVLKFHDYAVNCVDPALKHCVSDTDRRSRVLQRGQRAKQMQHYAKFAANLRAGKADVVVLPSDTRIELAAAKRAQQNWQQRRSPFKEQALLEFVHYDNERPSEVLSAFSASESELTAVWGESRLTALHDSLERPNDLSDTIIDLHMDVCFPNLQPLPTLLVCRCAAVQKLLTSKPSKFTLPVELVDGFTVVAPIHLPHHFTLAVATLNATPGKKAAQFHLLVQVFDSMGVPDVERQELPKFACKLVQQFMQRVLPQRLTITWEIQHMIDKVQTNDTDCGVYVLWWVRALAQCASDITAGIPVTDEVVAERMTPPTGGPEMTRLRHLVLAEILLGEALGTAFRFSSARDFVLGFRIVVGAFAVAEAMRNTCKRGASPPLSEPDGKRQCAEAVPAPQSPRAAVASMMDVSSDDDVPLAAVAARTKRRRVVDSDDEATAAVADGDPDEPAAKRPGATGATGATEDNPLHVMDTRPDVQPSSPSPSPSSSSSSTSSSSSSSSSSLASSSAARLALFASSTTSLAAPLSTAPQTQVRANATMYWVFQQLVIFCCFLLLCPTRSSAKMRFNLY